MAWAWPAAAVIVILVWSGAGTGFDPGLVLRPGGLHAIGSYVVQMFPPDVSAPVLRDVAVGGLETIAISLAGTTLAVVIAFSLSLAATRTVLFSGILYAGENLGWQKPVRMLLYGGARALLSVLRTVPEIVWALIFVFAVGLGPFPGVLALGVHTGGVLGKLFSEVLEDVSPKPLEALQASGASRLVIVAYGVLPQALPQCLSYALYRWEVNIRAAAVLGFVGAGGLGQQIHIAISLFLEHRLLTLILAIYVAVTAVDAISAALRRSVR